MSGRVREFVGQQGALDFWEDLRSILEDPGSIIQKVNSYLSAAQSEMQTVVDAERQSNSREFQDWTSGRVIQDAVIAGIENGTPAVVVATFYLDTKDKSLKSEIVEHARGLRRGRFPWIQLGTTVELNRERLTSFITGYSHLGISNAIHHAIQIEITGHPDIVGQPINIVVLDFMGLHWIEKGNSCDYNFNQ
jgi:hypothetical protein